MRVFYFFSYPVLPLQLQTWTGSPFRSGRRSCDASVLAQGAVFLQNELDQIFDFRRRANRDFLGVSFVCVSGFFGNTARFLDRGTVEEVQVSYVGTPGFLTSPGEGSSTGRGYYISGIVSFHEPAEIEQVKKIQRQFLEDGPGDMKTDSKDFENNSGAL